MVVVQVGEDDGLEVTGRVDAASSEPGADTLVGGDVDVDGEVEKGCQTGKYLDCTARGDSPESKRRYPSGWSIR